MSLGKHLPGYTVDDEGHTLMDLVNLCNSCECGMTNKIYNSCARCAPYKMKILNLIEKILENQGIRKIHVDEKYAPTTWKGMAYYYDDSRQCIGILPNEPRHTVEYTFHGTMVYYSGYKCTHGKYFASQVSYLVLALTRHGLKELSDYARLIIFI